jgi:hypothetical protein
MGADPRAALARGQMLLERNPERLPFQVFLHAGYANLPSGRTHALVLEVRNYQGRPLMLRAVLPYRHLGQAAGFAIHGPKLMETTADLAAYPQLFEAFYAGLDRYRVEGFSWARYLDESV